MLITKRIGLIFNFSLKQVLFEFDESFTEIDSMGFINNWQSFAIALNDILTHQYSSSLFYTNWPADIENILILLKLFPSSKVGKHALATRDTFYKASEKLIMFCEVFLYTK